MNSLENANAVIVLFVMDGCPHCDEYKPRLFRQIDAFQRHGQPFVYYDNGMMIQRGHIPVVVLDGNSDDDSIVDIAERYNVEAMPTTILLSRTSTPIKVEGAVEDREIYNILASACLANR